MSLMLNNPLAMQETQVQSLGLEDTLGEEVANHSSILPGEPNGQRSLVGHSPWTHRVRHHRATNIFTSSSVSTEDHRF